jgi:hypothetical protein
MADAPARGEAPRREAAEDVGEELLGETVHGGRSIYWACDRVRPGLLVCGVVFGLGQVS